MTTVYQISCAKCKRRVESLENHTWGRKSLKGLLAENPLHTIIILSWQVYYIKSELWCHITQKNQKIVRSLHILGRLNACANSVYQPFFAGGEAIRTHYHTMLRLCSWNSSDHRPVLSASIQIIIPCLDQNFRKFQEDQFSSWSKIEQWIWIIVFHKIQRPIDFLFIGSRYSKPWFQEIVAFLL